jgi:hypothetical protein
MMASGRKAGDELVSAGTGFNCRNRTLKFELKEIQWTASITP